MDAKVKNKILETSTSLEFSDQLECELRVPGLPSVTARVAVRFDGHAPSFSLPETAVDSDVEWYQFHDGVPGKLVHEENYGQILGKRSDGSTLFMDKCLLGKRAWKEQPVKYISADLVRGHLLEVQQNAQKSHSSVFDSYIVSGFALPHWPDYSSREDSDSMSFAMDRLTFPSPFGDITIFKIDEAIVRVLFEKPGDSAYENEHNLNSTLPLLGFVSGRRLHVVKKECFDLNGDLIQYGYLMNRAPHEQPRQMAPIPLSPEYESQLIYQLSGIFEKLLPEYLRVRGEIFFDEAIFHLHSALNSPLESKFSILAICFETLASSYSRFRSGNQEASSTYLAWDEFHKKMSPLISDFSKTFEPILSSEDFQSIKGKLTGINNRAMTNKFKAIFADTGIELTKDEESVLKKRNPAIHDGVLTRSRDKIDWQEIIQYEGTMLTIVNRVMLRLLKYSGPTIDYGTAGYPESAV